MASSAMRTTVMALERVFDGDDFAALVVAALRADPVRQLGLVALRARRRRLRFEEVVRAARAGAGLRMAAFWIWHRSTPGRHGRQRWLAKPRACFPDRKSTRLNSSHRCISY